jgi:hypothetical protein
MNSAAVPTFNYERDALRGKAAEFSGSSCIGNELDFRIILYWTILRE